MCTAISLGRFCGRNLDIEVTFKEEVIITPRKYPIKFKSERASYEHFAFIGIGIRESGYPLYFDAANEHGLYIAGLNYVGNAKYHKISDGKINLAPYELIPYLLSRYKSVSEVRCVLEQINLISVPFSDALPLSELHFFIADKNEAITVEPDSHGLSIYDNHVGVLANNPPFPYQLHNLSNYAGLSNGPLVNRFAPQLKLLEYSKGMGALGLPGDLSSESRFVRAAFHRQNLKNCTTPCDFFHILSSVEMPKGSLKLGELFEYTEYSAAVDLESIDYFFRTYDSYSITRIGLQDSNLYSDSINVYPMHKANATPKVKRIDIS